MFGPLYDRVIARIQQYDDAYTEDIAHVRYVKRVVVHRTVKMSHSFLASGPSLDGLLLPGQLLGKGQYGMM